MYSFWWTASYHRQVAMRTGWLLAASRHLITTSPPTLSAGSSPQITTDIMILYQLQQPIHIISNPSSLSLYPRFPLHPPATILQILLACSVSFSRPLRLFYMSFSMTLSCSLLPNFHGSTIQLTESTAAFDDYIYCQSLLGNSIWWKILHYTGKYRML